MNERDNDVVKLNGEMIDEDFLELCRKCGRSWEAYGPEDLSAVYWDTIAHQLKAVGWSDENQCEGETFYQLVRRVFDDDPPPQA